MFNFKLKTESFEKEFGTILYPKSNHSKLLIIAAIVILIHLTIPPSEEQDFFNQAILPFLKSKFFLAFLAFKIVISPHIQYIYLTTKGIYINSFLRKGHLIPWGDIDKIEVETDYKYILILDKNKTTYHLSKSIGRGSKKNIDFDQHMRLIKKYRPDIRESYFNVDIIQEFKDSEINPFRVIILLAIILGLGFGIAYCLTYYQEIFKFFKF